MFNLIDMLGHASPVIDIVDVGALWMNEENISYRAILKPGHSRVVGFEPVKEECDRLNRLGRSGERYLPYFIGDGTERTFVQNNKTMTSSLFEPNTRLIERFGGLAELMQPVARERVKTTRLDDVPEITAIDFLKLDIQGGELDAIRGCERHLKRTVVVQTEVEFVPLYENQPLFAEIDQEMRRHVFLFHQFGGLSGAMFKPFAAQNQAPPTQVLWTDAIYVRDFTRLAELDSEQLIRMAVIVHQLYQSCDLAALCLQHYDAKMKTQLWKIYMQRLLGAAPPPPPPL